jgi:hypothetical protein
MTGANVICGADIQSNDLILVGVEQDQEGKCVLVSEVCAKLALVDGKDQATVRHFSRAVAAFVRNHNVKQIALRGRNNVGQFAGGAASFKIEGIIQCLDECVVEIIMPTTVSSAQRKHSFAKPPGMFKYQENAFLTGRAALVKTSK